jgi:chromosomal replication initiation ATPase DnaA
MTYAEELTEHYKAVRARLETNAIRPVKTPPPVRELPPPTIIVDSEADSDFVSMERLLNTIAEVALVNPRSIYSKDRHQQTCRLRFIFYFMAREYCTNFHSYPSIGKFIGCDHTTVLHGHNRVARDLPQFSDFIQKVKLRLGNNC